MTYVRTRLALDRLRPGDVLQVRLKGDDPVRQVPASAVRHGHRILSTAQEEGGVSIILIERA